MRLVEKHQINWKLQIIRPISQFGLWILRVFDSQQVQKFIKSTRDDIKTRKHGRGKLILVVKRLYNSALAKIGLNLCCFRWHLWKQLPSQWPATLAFHISSTACDLRRTFQPSVSPLKWIATPNLVFLEHRALFCMKTTFVNKKPEGASSHLGVW